MSGIRPGDIVEIALEGGLSYVQVTHDHPSYPHVVRGLPGRHRSRPDDLNALTRQPPAFRALIPLEGALRKLGLQHSVVEHLDIPEEDRGFPTFRMPIRDKQGDIVYWWFWDGRGLRFSVDLHEDETKLPLREVMSAEQFLALLTEDRDPA